MQKSRRPDWLVIIIIILIHYHKGLSAVGFESAYRFIGLAFLFLISCILCPKGVVQLCKAIEKNIQLGAGKKGGGTGGKYMCRLFVFFTE